MSRTTSWKACGEGESLMPNPFVRALNALFGRQMRDFYGITGAQDLIPTRTSAKAGAVTVTNDTTMRHSAVWACLRLRADLISTMPVDVYRRGRAGPGGGAEPAGPGRAGRAAGRPLRMAVLEPGGPGPGRQLHRPDHPGQRRRPPCADRPAGAVRLLGADDQGRADLPDRWEVVHPGQGVAREAVHPARPRGRLVAGRVRGVVDRRIPVHPAVRLGLVCRRGGTQGAHEERPADRV